MKNYIAVGLSVFVLFITGCNDSNEEQNLKASLEIRKFDSNQVGNSLEEGLGDVSSTFEEKEELAFTINLKNEGIETKQLSWTGCTYAVVQLFNSDSEMVFHSAIRPVGCAADINEMVLYGGESLSNIIPWDQELYTYNESDGIVETGEYLTAGEYTVVSYVSIGVGPFGSAEDITIDMEEQSLVIEAAATE